MSSSENLLRETIGIVRAFHDLHPGKRLAITPWGTTALVDETPEEVAAARAATDDALRRLSEYTHPES